jgi:hypothetical protein
MTTCEHSCGMPLCPHRCTNDGEHEKHLCSNIHRCPRRCNKTRGLCCLTSGGSKTGTGEVGSRLQCTIMLAPKQIGHEGPHDCNGEIEKHICMAKCPSCRNFCRKTPGHLGLHDTTHGPMINSQFIVQNTEQQVEIVYDEGKKRLKFFAGQNGAKFTCDSYCRTMGRGHVHLSKCDGNDGTECQYDSEISLVTHGRRHRADFSEHVDEVRHDRFWQECGFVDPIRHEKQYDDKRINEFNLCRVTYQESALHDVYKCTRHVGHDKLDTSSASYLQSVSLLSERFESGTFSPSGHHFEQTRSHVYHHYVLIDASKNMTTQDANPSLPALHPGGAEDFDLHSFFNNRFGCAVEFALRYLHIRHKLSPTDRMTVILFNRKNITVLMDDESTSHYYALLDLMIDYSLNNKLDQKSPKYANVFEKVRQLMVKNKSTFQNKILLLSGPKTEEKKRKATLGSFVSGIPKWKSSRSTSSANVVDSLGDSKANRKLSQLIEQQSSPMIPEPSPTTSPRRGMTSSTSLPSLSTLASAADAASADKSIVMVKFGTQGNDNKIKRFTLVAKRCGHFIDESLIRSNQVNDPTLIKSTSTEPSRARIRKKDPNEANAHPYPLENVIMCNLISQALEPFEHIQCQLNENIINGGLWIKTRSENDQVSPIDSEFVQPDFDESRKKDMMERDNLAKEILATERTYVTNLKLMIDLYQVPLSKYQSHLVSESDRGSMFSGLMNIYGLHKNLLSQLEQRMANWNNDQKIGDVFVRLGPMFLLYTQYTTKYENAVETFVKCRKSSLPFRRFLQIRRRDPYSHGHTLNSFMILPVQRIPRYRMLLEGLIKYTSRVNPNHPDLNDLTQALKQISDVAENLNTKIHERQNLYKLKILSDHISGIKDLIQPNRWFIREFRLKYLTQQQQYIDAVMFLFNDILIVTDSPAPVSNRKQVDEDINWIDIMDMPEMGDGVKYETKLVFNLTEIRVHPLNYASSPITMVDDGGYRNRTLLSFQVTDLGHKVSEFSCQSEKDKEVVVSALSEAINDMSRRKRTFDQANQQNMDRFHRISAYSFDMDNNPQQIILPSHTLDYKPQTLTIGLGSQIIRKNKSAPTTPHDSTSQDQVNPYL